MYGFLCVCVCVCVCCFFLGGRLLSWSAKRNGRDDMAARTRARAHTHTHTPFLKTTTDKRMGNDTHIHDL
jgi:hypothetical protein